MKSLFSGTASRIFSSRGTFFFFLVGALFSFFLWQQNISSSFFYDEAVYVNLAEHPFRSDYYADKIFFRHPPLYYLILSAVGIFSGFGEVVMRFPSLVFSFFSMVILYFLGRRLHSPAFGVVVSSLLLLSTLQQQYAQAATMYALTTLLVTICIYGLVARRYAVMWGAFFGALFSHFFAFLLLVPIIMENRFLSHLKEKASFKIKVIFGISLFFLLPILLPGASFHLSRVSFDYWWFQLLNLYFSLSPVLLAGFLFYSSRNNKNEQTTPLIFLCVSFLIFSVILPPFVRYLAIFYPIFLALGTLGVWKLIQEVFSRGDTGQKMIFGILFVATCVLTFPAGSFGIYPLQHSPMMDIGDTIHTESWREIVAVMASSGGGSVMTSRVVPFKYYADKSGLQYVVSAEAKDWNETVFRDRVSRGLDNWIILQSLFIPQRFYDFLEGSSLYERYADFPYSTLYRKKNLAQ